MKNKLIETLDRIKPFVHRTVVLQSHLINDIIGADVYFKCENFQRMGAFKMRGAVNAVLQLSEEQSINGVVTHSSGNFAQALSLAAKSVGIPAYIVMPSNAPEVKKNAVLAYGGQITMCEATIPAREQAAEEIIRQTGATLLHPSNDLEVILGQGTAAMELLEDFPDLKYIFSPVGGGGLVGGTILAAQHFGKNCKVVGAEPAVADDAYQSLISGKIEPPTGVDTIADGLKSHLGSVNFPIIQEGIDKIICVEEHEIVEAMRLIWERLKIVVEASSAVALAALIKNKSDYSHQKIGIIISGGNVDLSNLPF